MSTSSIRLIVEPADQLDLLSCHSINQFEEAAKKVKAYVLTGKDQKDAVNGLFNYFDKELSCLITESVSASKQAALKLSIKGVLARMHKVQSKDLGPYEVAEFCVIEEFNQLGKAAKKLINSASDQNLFFNQSDI